MAAMHFQKKYVQYLRVPRYRQMLFAGWAGVVLCTLGLLAGPAFGQAEKSPAGAPGAPVKAGGGKSGASKSGAPADGKAAAEFSEELAALEKSGLKWVRGSLLVQEELELRELMAKEKKLKKAVADAQRTLQRAEAAKADVQVRLKSLADEHRRLNLFVASVRSVQQRNQAIAAMNEILHQVDELQRDQSVAEELNAARSEFSHAREQYIELALSARKLADQSESAWSKLQKDEAAQAAVQAFNKAAKKSLSLEPSKSYLAMLKQLAKLEAGVLREDIELRQEGGNTFVVPVTLNGSHTVEMVVDSGASIVSLPYNVALQAGIDLTKSERDVVLETASGARVTAKLVKLDKVRVGKFELQDVEATVLPADLGDAPPLLGMSYLGKFDFRLDSDARKLKLASLNAPPPSDSKVRKGKGDSPPSRKSNRTN